MSDTSILLVEDNPRDEALTLRALRRNNIETHVAVAHDGVEALDYLLGVNGRGSGWERPLPRLVLLDLNLPRIDGLQVLRRIRAAERTRLLPVIILTSSDEEKDILQGYGLGTNGYVRKPVDIIDFTEAIRTLGLCRLLQNDAIPASG